jgi:hypothetical protein
MTALRAQLDPKTVRSSNRTANRRMLHLPAEGVTNSGTSDVLILDMSVSGLLLETSGDLSEGDAIDLDLAETSGVRAIVRWSSGQLFGCQFQQPISTAAVSAALLRASYDPRSSPKAIAPPVITGLADYSADVDHHDEELSLGAKLRLIIGLAVLSWGIIIAATALVWTNLR